MSTNETGVPAQTAEEKLAEMSILLEAAEAKVKEQEARIMAIPNGGDVQVSAEELALMQDEVAKDTSKMVTITISGDSDGKNRPVFVGHQGKGWAIQRSVPARVPLYVVHVLQNAIKSHYNCDAQGNITESLIPLYPFTIAL